MAIPVLSDLVRGGGSAFGTEGVPTWATTFRAFTDCVTTVTDNDFSFGTSGTGASWLANPSDAGSLGVVRGNLGTTTAGRVSLSSNSFSLMRAGLGELSIQTRLRHLVASSPTDAFASRVGFIDAAAESVDGVFFRCTHAANGGRWEAVCRANNVETVADTGVAPVIGGAATNWQNLRIAVNAAGTEAKFSIGTTTVATVTTNIPGAGRDFGYGLSVLRSAGTTTLNVIDVDLMDIQQVFTTPR